MAFSIGDFGYVGTGHSDTDEEDDFWKYDPGLNDWTATGTFSGDKRREGVGFTLSGKGYVAAGFFDSFQLSDIQEYDPTTNMWSERIFADALLQTNNAAVFNAFGRAYIAYGSVSTPKVVAYNSLTNELEDLGDLFSLGGSRSDGIAFFIENTGYFSSGFSGSTLFNDISIFDFVGPKPNNFIPANGETGVSLTPFLQLDFEEQVRSVGGKKWSIYKGDELLKTATTIDSDIFFDGISSVLDPGILEPNTIYSVVVEPGAYENAGELPFVGVNDLNTWSFRTLESDDTPPTYTAFFVNNQFIGMEALLPNPKITMFFDEAIRVIEGKRVSILTGAGDLVAEQITVGGELDRRLEVLFDNLLLKPATTYYVQIEEGSVEDYFGNPFVGISDNTTFSFMTEPSAELDPPIIVSLNPMNGVSILIDRNTFTITFNEQLATVGGKKITLFNSMDNSVLGEITTVKDDNVAFVNRVFEFTGLSLSSSTTYHITIEAGAFKDQYSNVFGGINDDSTWSFSTGGASSNEEDEQETDEEEEVITGVSDDIVSTLKLYPVPANQELFIENSEMAIRQVNLYNVAGLKVLTKDFNNQPSGSLNVKDIPSGMFILEIIDLVNRNVISKRIMKN